jgi:uncharacterized protein (TIGR03067 family)
MAKACVLLIIAILFGCSTEDSQQERAQPPSAVAADFQKLHGDWIATSHEFKGAPSRFGGEHAMYRLSFDGTHVAETIATETEHAIVQLVPSKQPKEITFEYPQGTASWGIYEFKGDNLVITWAIGKNTEPTETARATFVLERNKN